MYLPNGTWYIHQLYRFFPLWTGRGIGRRLSGMEKELSLRWWRAWPRIVGCNTHSFESFYFCGRHRRGSFCSELEARKSDNRNDYFTIFIQRTNLKYFKRPILPSNGGWTSLKGFFHLKRATKISELVEDFGGLGNFFIMGKNGQCRCLMCWRRPLRWRRGARRKV